MMRLSHIISFIILFSPHIAADSKTSKEADNKPPNIPIPITGDIKKRCKTEFHPDDDSRDFCVYFLVQWSLA